MIVAFASNQVMFAKADSGNGVTEVITTDPVPMNGMNRASATLNVHALLNPGSGSPQTPQLTAQAQLSNDGVNWVDGGPSVTATGMGAGSPPIDTEDADAQFIRFQFSYDPDTGSSGTDYTFICFDLHVRLDHS